MADKTITGAFTANTYYETTPIAVALTNSFGSHTIELQRGTGVYFENYRYIEFKCKLQPHTSATPYVVISNGPTVIKVIDKPSLFDGTEYSTYRVNTALLLNVASLTITSYYSGNVPVESPVSISFKDFKFGTSNTGFNYITIGTFGDGTTNPEPDTYVVSTGESFNVTAYPAVGNVINNIYIDDVAQSNISPTVSVTSVTTNKSIVYSFDNKEFEYKNVSISKNTGGSVTPFGTIRVKVGDPLKISATPDTGYKLNDITVNGVVYTNLTEHTIDSVLVDSNVFASFSVGTQVKFIIMSVGLGNGSGIIYPSTSIEILPGRDQTVSFIPSADSIISDVRICSFLPSGPTEPVSYGPIESFTFTDVSKSYGIEVDFKSKYDTNNLIRLKRGRLANWSGKSLVDGEIGYDRTNNQLRIGNNPVSSTDFSSCPILSGIDEKVKVDITDLTAGFLFDKIFAGTNISVAVVHPTIDTTALRINALPAWGTITGALSAQTDLVNALATRALAENGVTGGDTHNHTNGHGGQIAYNNLSGLPVLGNSSAKDVGTGSGTVAAGDHTHSDLPIVTANIGKIKISAADLVPKFFAEKIFANGSTIEFIKTVGTGSDEIITIGVKSGIFEPAIIKNSAFNKSYGSNTTNVRMNGAVSVGSIDEIARVDHVHPVDTSRAPVVHNHDTTYAPITKGVTNGDSHDHNGGDGAQIAYANLMGLPTLGTAAARNAGVSNGLAELGSNGKVLPSQLPASISDIQEFANLAGFPAVGSSGVIYVALDTNKTYRWSGSQYIEISSSLVLGETSATAYRGDRGVDAYNHSIAAHAPTDAQKNSLITKAEIEAKLTGEITTHTHPNAGTVTGPGTTTPRTVSMFADATGKVIAEASGVLYHPASGTNYNAGIKFISNKPDIDCGINTRFTAGHSILQIANNINTTYFGNVDTALPGCLVRLDTRNTRRYGLFNVHTRAAGATDYQRPFVIFPGPSGSIVIEPSGNVQMGWDSETSTDLGFKLSVNGIINANMFNVINVANPLADNDAVNKKYVDTKTANLGTLTNKKVWIGNSDNKPSEQQAAELPDWQGGKFLITTETEGVLGYASGSGGTGGLLPSGSPGDMLVCVGGSADLFIGIKFFNGMSRTLYADETVGDVSSNWPVSGSRRVGTLFASNKYNGDVTFVFEDSGANQWDGAVELKYLPDTNEVEIWAYSPYTHQATNTISLYNRLTSTWVDVCTGTNTMQPDPFHEIAPVNKYLFTEDNPTLHLVNTGFETAGDSSWVILPSGPAGTVLVSQGIGKQPRWLPISAV